MWFGQPPRIELSRIGILGIELSQLTSWLEKYKECRLAVAVSGGADSLALMVFLAEQGLKPSVLSVHHQMRAEATKEIEYVAMIAERFHLSHYVLSSTHEPPHEPPPRTQAQARALRYALLSQWCNENAIQACALAHHAHDQAETFLFRLARGSGIGGLAAMREEIIHQGCCFVRPLLDVPKEALKTFLQQRNIQWCEDPSNVSPKYTRTHLGKALDNLSPCLSVDDFCQAAQGAFLLKQELQKRVEAFLTQKGQGFAAGYYQVDKRALIEQDPIIAEAILAYLIQWVSGAPFRPRHLALSSLNELIKNAAHTASTLGYCQIQQKGEVLYFYKELAFVEPPIPVSAQQVLWDKRFSYHPPPISTNRQANLKGLEIGALGIEGQRQVELMDKDAPIPKMIRASLPALWRDGELVAVPHLHFGDLELARSIKFLR